MGTRLGAWRCGSSWGWGDLPLLWAGTGPRAVSRPPDSVLPPPALAVPEPTPGLPAETLQSEDTDATAVHSRCQCPSRAPRAPHALAPLCRWPGGYSQSWTMQVTSPTGGQRDTGATGQQVWAPRPPQLVPGMSGPGSHTAVPPALPCRLATVSPGAQPCSSAIGRPHGSVPASPGPSQPALHTLACFLPEPESLAHSFVRGPPSSVHPLPPAHSRLRTPLGLAPALSPGSSQPCSHFQPWQGLPNPCPSS